MTGATGGDQRTAWIGSQSADPRFIAAGATGETGKANGSSGHQGDNNNLGLDRHASGGQLATDLTNFSNPVAALNRGHDQGAGSVSTTDPVVAGVGYGVGRQDGSRGSSDVFRNDDTSSHGHKLGH
jgi:hypothetical protein